MVLESWPDFQHVLLVYYILQKLILGYDMLFNSSISERSPSTKLKLNESTKRNAWLSLRDASPGGQPTVRSVMLFGVIDNLFSCTPRLFTSENMVHHDRTR